MREADVGSAALGVQTQHARVPVQATEDTAALQAESDREQATYEAEWKHLTRIIEVDRKRRVQSVDCT